MGLIRYRLSLLTSVSPGVELKKSLYEQIWLRNRQAGQGRLSAVAQTGLIKVVLLSPRDKDIPGAGRQATNHLTVWRKP
jgi:hypothetical protein